MRVLWPSKAKSNFLLDILLWKGASGHDFEVQAKIFELNFLSFKWSKWDNLSAYQIEIFLNFSKHSWLLILLAFWGEFWVIMCHLKSGKVCWARLYSVFHYIWTQELGSYELVLQLLMALKASMWPQDWAQITFRSEIILIWFYKESGRWLSKGRISMSGEISTIYRVSQTWFLLLVLNLDYHNLDNLSFT